MAIDSASKRRRALGFGQQPGIFPPAPDGSLSADDRAALAGLYYAGGEPPPPPDPIPVSPGGTIDASQLVMVVPGILNA